MTRLRKVGGGQLGAVDAAQRNAILYAHGGGFVVGGGDSYAGFAAWLAAATGADVYLPDYRLAPEHPQPAATDDLFAAYRAILELGHDPGRIAVVGDSAGGSPGGRRPCARCREMGVPSPAALVLISPWLDLSLSGASVGLRRQPRSDAAPRGWLAAAARNTPAACTSTTRGSRRCSPTSRTLPPTLVQVGTDEILLDDSTRFADRA